MPPDIIAAQTVYSGWTRLIKARVRIDAEDEVTREIEDHGPAVAVLPFDPVRRTAILVQLLRAPVLLTAGEPHLLEAIAGMLEGADPADCARREAMEEAGLRLGTLEHAASLWTCPGISTERIHLFLAAYTKQDRIAAGGGVIGESENITVLELPLDELWSQLERGVLTDMKAVTLLLMLRVRRPDLFPLRPGSRMTGPGDVAPLFRPD